MTTRTKPATPAPTPDAPGLAALERGETLPATWYTDPTFYAREQEHIFRRSWQYVGLTEQVANPGDFFTARAAQLAGQALRICASAYRTTCPPSREAPCGPTPTDISGFAPRVSWTVSRCTTS